MSRSAIYRSVRNAISSGRLVRPNTCGRCKTTPEPGSDGRSTIHAHHEDYSRPLDVEWLCAKCHRKETPLPKVMGAPCHGEKNGFSKLTNDLVIEILNSKESSRIIAARIGIEKTTVIRIRQRKAWAHIAAAPEHKA